MKKKILDDIKNIAFFGTVYPDEIKRFDDSHYFNEENLFHYRLSKIKAFIGEKNGKELILGLQTFYTDLNGKEIANAEARDKAEKELDIKVLEIAPNDYICHFYIRTGDDRITQLKFVTRKGKEFIVGSDEGEEKFVEFINDNNDFIILYFFGGYRKCLEAIAAGYIPLKSYLGNTAGYFQLKKKMKEESFRKAVEAKLKDLNNSDVVLYRVCLLPDPCFNSIIRFCLF